MFSQSQTVEDDFEGNGTITWEQDPTQPMNFDDSFANPHVEGINTSATVLRYHDDGKQYANLRFNTSSNFDLSTNNTFSLKIYIPSSGITGSQPNQISLKLQDGTLGLPYTTQSEIIKSVTLDSWQIITFDFDNDLYINQDAGSPDPITRTDFNRIILQVNGENNYDHVVAYIDDFLYDGTINNTDNQTVEDDFEGSGTITWEQDPTQPMSFDDSFANPHVLGINTSATVLRYHDDGKQYANLRFNTSSNFDLSTNNTFSLKIYIPSSGITGSQPNQISLKLQDGTLGLPYTTQSEIIKSVTLDSWQIITFDFDNDLYINQDAGSPDPITRTDFNRVVLQVNGENNFDHVVAYIDDFLYDGTINDSGDPEDPVDPVDPVFDNLVWSDEFDGGAIDNTKWFHQTQLPAGGSWYNNEEQHYTNRTDNSYVSDGTLKIVAKKETFNDQGHTKQYTSARLNSKFAFKYGRVEVRAKLPSVAGTWPAIWMLGKNINEAGAYWQTQGFGTTTWPYCGEIDIMEPNIPKTEILGTWHWNNGSGYQINSKHVSISNNETSQNFHNYILEWSSGEMKIYIDNTLINQMNTVTPFNEEFYFIFNIAMGGNLGGTIDSNFSVDTMEIDYVRVYQESIASVADENWFENVLLYPNPVKDNFTIQVPAKLVGAEATIYSLLGQEIDSFVQEESRKNIDLSHYKKGIYIIKLVDGSKFATYKIYKM